MPRARLMRRGLLVLATLLAASLAASGQTLMVKIPAPAEVRLAAFAEDGARVAAALGNDRVVIWALPSGKQGQVLEFGKERPERLLFTAGGKQLVVGLASGKAEVRDVSSGALLRTIETRAMTTMAVSGDGRGRPPRVRRRGGAIGAMAVSRDGRWLATANASDPRVVLWDFVSGKKLHELNAEFGGTEDVAFSPDGNLLASAHDNTDIYLWDTATGQLKFKVSDLLMAPFAVCFTPDGKSIATGGADRAVHLIDARTGKVRRSFPAEEFPIVAIQVSPDGTSAATVHVDARSFALPAPVMLWSLASGQVVKRIEFTDTRPNGGGLCQRRAAAVHDGEGHGAERVVGAVAEKVGRQFRSDRFLGWEIYVQAPSPGHPGSVRRLRSEAPTRPTIALMDGFRGR